VHLTQVINLCVRPACHRLSVFCLGMIYERDAGDVLGSEELSF